MSLPGKARRPTCQPGRYTLLVKRWRGDSCLLRSVVRLWMSAPSISGGDEPVDLAVNMVPARTSCGAGWVTSATAECRPRCSSERCERTGPSHCGGRGSATALAAAPRDLGIPPANRRAMRPAWSAPVRPGRTRGWRDRSAAVRPIGVATDTDLGAIAPGAHGLNRADRAAGRRLPVAIGMPTALCTSGFGLMVGVDGGRHRHPRSVRPGALGTRPDFPRLAVWTAAPHAPRRRRPAIDTSVGRRRGRSVAREQSTTWANSGKPTSARTRVALFGDFGRLGQESGA